MRAIRSTIASPRPKPRSRCSASVPSRRNSSKISACCSARDADAGIDHLDAESAALAPHADQHAAVPRVADRVRHQVHERPRQSMSGSVRTTAVVGTSRSARPLRSARGANSATSRRSSGPSGTFVDRGVTTPASSFEMSSSALSSRSIDSNASLDVLDQTLGVLRQLGLGQGGQEQAGRVERLQQIVRGGGEEAGLGEVGGIGQRLRLLECPVAALELGQGLLELGRALADLGLEQGRPLEQRELRALQIHAPLDPADQDVADLAQLRVLALELGEPAVGVAGDHGHGLRPMAMPVKVWLTCIEPHCSPKLAKPVTLLAACRRDSRCLIWLRSASRRLSTHSKPITTSRRADPLPEVLRTAPRHAAQQVAPFGQREHQALVDRAVEAEAAVRVGLLDRAHILGPTQPHHQRMGGEDHRRQLGDRAADQARIDLDRGLGVELGDEAPLRARLRSPPSSGPTRRSAGCGRRCTGRLVATRSSTAPSA